MGRQPPTLELMDVHTGYMARAIELAHAAADAGEVPVGAVVVDESGRIIGEGFNRSIGTSDPSAHAEIVALRAAARHTGNYRLDRCSLYVTLEPCTMCLGAVFHARIKSLFFGASDPKGGACGSVVQLDQFRTLNPHCVVQGGVMRDACSGLLSDYFKRLRQTHRERRTRLREDALRLTSLIQAPHGHALFFDDLASSKGLRVHVWSSHGTSESKDHLVLCIPSLAHWAWQFQCLLSSSPPVDTLVWCVDLPGQGYSDKTKTGAEFDQAYQVSVLGELISRSGASMVTVVAQGLSAMLAMDLAHIAKGKVHRLCFVDPCIHPTAALAGSKGRLPASVAQLEERLAETSLCGSRALDLLRAPYPDSGHARGLLRWLNQAAVQGAQGIDPVRAVAPVPCSTAVFMNTPTLKCAVHEFLHFWSISALSTPWNEVSAKPWTFIIGNDATIG